MTEKRFYVSGIYGAFEGLQAEVDRRTNLYLKELYEEGFRRFRIGRMPRTGDGERIKIMAWPK